MTFDTVRPFIVGEQVFLYDSGFRETVSTRAVVFTEKGTYAMDTKALTMRFLQVPLAVKADRGFK